MRSFVLAAITAVLVLPPAASDAAFPGASGRIAADRPPRALLLPPDRPSWQPIRRVRSVARVAASARAARGPCERALEHATGVLARSARAAVFWTRVGTYGCLFSSRRAPQLLARHTDAQSPQAARLAGRFAAIRILHGYGNDAVNTDRLRLFDLRSRRRSDELTPLGLPAYAGDVVQDFVVTARGALAWIGLVDQFSERLGDELPVEVHRLLGGRDRVLDRATRPRSSAPAEPATLTLTRDQGELRWVRDGVVHSASMR